MVGKSIYSWDQDFAITERLGSPIFIGRQVKDHGEHKELVDAIESIRLLVLWACPIPLVTTSGSLTQDILRTGIDYTTRGSRHHDLILAL